MSGFSTILQGRFATEVCRLGCAVGWCRPLGLAKSKVEALCTQRQNGYSSCVNVSCAPIPILQITVRPRNVIAILIVLLQGIDPAKLRTIVKIKSERGARVGRYIIASTTAKYQVPSRGHLVKCTVTVRKDGN